MGRSDRTAPQGTSRQGEEERCLPRKSNRCSAPRRPPPAPRVWFVTPNRVAPCRGTRVTCAHLVQRSARAHAARRKSVRVSSVESSVESRFPLRCSVDVCFRWCEPRRDASVRPRPPALCVCGRGSHICHTHVACMHSDPTFIPCGRWHSGLCTVRQRRRAPAPRGSPRGDTHGPGP